MSRPRFTYTRMEMLYSVTELSSFKPGPPCQSPALSLRGGANGGGRSGVHRVMEDDVIPAYGRQRVGAAVEPTHTFDKVLVSPVSQSAAEDTFF